MSTNTYVKTQLLCFTFSASLPALLAPGWTECMPLSWCSSPDSMPWDPQGRLRL